MLCCEFKGLPGESAVRQGMYAIVKAPKQHHIIDKEAWSRRVLPGSVLNMSVVIAHDFKGRCPRCLSLEIPHNGSHSEQCIIVW